MSKSDTMAFIKQMLSEGKSVHTGTGDVIHPGTRFVGETEATAVHGKPEGHATPSSKSWERYQSEFMDKEAVPLEDRVGIYDPNVVERMKMDPANLRAELEQQAGVRDQEPKSAGELTEAGAGSVGKITRGPKYVSPEDRKKANYMLKRLGYVEANLPENRQRQGMKEAEPYPEIGRRISGLKAKESLYNDFANNKIGYEGFKIAESRLDDYMKLYQGGDRQQGIPPTPDDVEQQMAEEEASLLPRAQHGDRTAAQTLADKFGLPGPLDEINKKELPPAQVMQQHEAATNTVPEMDQAPAPSEQMRQFAKRQQEGAPPPSSRELLGGEQKSPGTFSPYRIAQPTEMDIRKKFDPFAVGKGASLVESFLSGSGYRGGR